MTHNAAGAALIALATAAAGAQPVIEQIKPNNWTLKPEITLKAWHEQYISNPNPSRDQIYASDTWEFTAAAVVFPIVERTASSVADVNAVKGELTFQDHVEDDSVEIPAQLYHSGTRLAKWTLEPIANGGTYKGQMMRLQLEVPTICYETVFNEEAAHRFTWPKGDWPPIAKSTFEPMSYIDIGPSAGPYDMTPIRNLVKRWTDGKDPRTVEPVVLAKWFTGQIVNAYQVSGNGLNASRTGLLEGIDLVGAPAAAQRMRGTEFDMVCVLTAAFREAGLPARVVVGYDAGAAKGKDGFLEKKRSDLQIRAWVEFALFDEERSALYWIPVDPVRIRKSTSRMRNDFLDQPLKYFGTHDELDDIIPFAFQFHPPTRVQAYGSPGFWGWGVYGEYPPPGQAFQEVRIQAQTTATRAGDQQQERQRSNDGRSPP